MSRFAGMNIGMGTNAQERKHSFPTKKEIAQGLAGPPGTGPSTSNISPLANIAPNNIFKKVGTNNNMPIFKANMPDRPSNAVLASQAQNANVDKTKRTFTPMDQTVDAGYIPAWDTDGKFGAPSTSQYNALTNLTKLRRKSDSGELKGLAPVYGNDGRITGWQKSNAYQNIVPGYDLDGVSFSEKQSALRLGMPFEEYQNLSWKDRWSHLGTEFKSAGAELETGIKGIFSNLPFAKLFAGFGSNTTGTNDQQNNQQNNRQNVSSSNTGVMANVPSFDPPTSSTSGQLAGMSPEMLQYYLGLSDVDKQAFLSLDNAGRMAMMKPSGGQEDQNYNFLGQYVPNTLSGMMDQNISYLSNAQLRAYNSMSPEEQSNFRSLESLTEKLEFLKSKFPDLK